MVRYSDELLDEIKSKSDIIDIVSQYVVLKRAGRNYMGLCPFHKEKSGSFCVSPDKQIFHCFGCGVGGNVFHFISKIENLSYRESIEMLANRAGIELPVSGDFEDDKLVKLKTRIYELNKETAEFYHQNLYKPTAKPAQEYVKKRHLDNKTLKAFKIGYSGRFNETYMFLKSKGFTFGGQTSIHHGIGDVQVAGGSDVNGGGGLPPGSYLLSGGGLGKGCFHGGYGGGG